MWRVDIQTTASLLSLRPETVKRHLHRARRLLRAELQKALFTFSEIFPFGKHVPRWPSVC